MAAVTPRLPCAIQSRILGERVLLPPRLAMVIRQLCPGDAAAYQALRLEGLRESPTAFGASYAAEAGRTLAEVAARLQTGADAPVIMFGAFAEEQLVGVAGLARTAADKLAHNATVVGMYVALSFRRRRVGEALLDAVIAHARAFPHLRNLKLSANATNAAAVRLYQSRGFAKYGLEREALCVDGIFYDEELYALRLTRTA